METFFIPLSYITKLLDKTLGTPLIYLLDLFYKKKHLTLGYFTIYQKPSKEYSKIIEDVFRCPICEDDRAVLNTFQNKTICQKCNHSFPLKDGIPNFSLKNSSKPKSNSINNA